MENRKILLVEDDELTRLLIQRELEQKAYEVTSVGSVPEALQAFHQYRYPIVLSDIEMKPVDGFELLKQLSAQSNPPLTLFMTSKGSLTSACEAISLGAFDYLGKPVQSEQLFSVLDRAFQEVVSKGKIKVDWESGDLGLVGRSPKMVEVYRNVARASRCDSNVLICGESGTGKELIARAIHDHSARKDNRFVTVNCGALTETLLESELFGHLKGSFTGAISNKKGLFEEANGGTLFLDEIGDISPGLQVKLLRVIQEGEFKPVGSVENRKTNVRVISATHRNLPKMVSEEKFREDLFYRLKVLYLQLPSLRERPEDIIPLAKYFLNKKKFIHKKCHLSEEAIQKLLTYRWPGNIRELEHSVERAVAMSQSTTLFPEDFMVPEESSEHCAVATEGDALRPANETIIAKEEPLISLEELERRHIEKVVRLTHFNKTRAAQVLGIDRATLYRKAERYQISLGPNEAVSPVPIEI